MALTTALPSASARAVETAAPSTRARPAQRHRPKFGVVGGSHRAVRLDQPVRLTRRGRLASRLGVAVSVAVIAFGMYQAVQPMAPEASSVRTVTVLPGQSLWTA